MTNQFHRAALETADKSRLRGRFLSRAAGLLNLVLAIALIPLALGAFAAGPALAQTTAPAQNAGPAGDGATTVATHDDWTVRCGLNAQTQAEVCYIVQQVTSKDTGQAVLQLAIGKFGPEKRDLALVTLPLGVRLPPGIALEVIGREPHKRPFERCLRIGCQAQLLLDDALLTEFRAGLEGRIIVQDTSGQTIALPFSLKGFTAAFAGIK
jgi:invasion protein IalB